MNVQELKAKLEAASTQKHIDLETVFKLLDEATAGKAEKTIFEKIEEIARQLQNGNEVTLLCDKYSTEYSITFKLMRDRSYLTEGELFYVRMEDEESVERYGITHPKQIAEFVREKIFRNEEITEILEIHVYDKTGAKKEVE